jgi:hypothetical protein
MRYWVWSRLDAAHLGRFLTYGEALACVKEHAVLARRSTADYDIEKTGRW